MDNGMSRNINFALLPVAVCVGIAPAQAAPSVRTMSVSGTVASACTLSATSIVVSASRSGSSQSFSTSPANVTASCNGAGGGRLSVSSTRLVSTGNTRNYTIAVAGWGAGNATYNTMTLPVATTKDRTGVGTSTLTFSCSTGCDNNLSNNTPYTATVTLGLAPIP